MNRRNLLSIVILGQLAFFSIPAFPAEPATNSAVSNGPFLQQFYDTEETAASRAKKIQAPNPVWTTIKIILYIGVLGAGAYFLVRFVIKKGSVPATGDSNFVEVLMTKSVGLGGYLQIVKVGPSYYLLGHSGDGIRLIDRIQDQETIDYIELNKDSMKPKETKFVDILNYLPISKKLDKWDFLKGQKDRLKKL